MIERVCGVEDHVESFLAIGVLCDLSVLCALSVEKLNYQP